MKKFLVQFLLAVLVKLKKAAKPKMRRGKGPGKLEKRLRGKIRRDLPSK